MCVGSVNSPMFRSWRKRKAAQIANAVTTRLVQARINNGCLNRSENSTSSFGPGISRFGARLDNAAVACASARCAADALPGRGGGTLVLFFFAMKERLSFSLL